MTHPSVLILGVYHQTLAVMRSLHRAGYKVVLGRGPGRCPEQFSRACNGTWIHPSTADPRFGPALRSYLNDHPEIQFIFPIGEDDVLAVTTVDQLGTPNIAIAAVAPDLVQSCRDKSSANLIATRAGILVPPSTIARSVKELLESARAIGFPVIVKPLTSKLPVLGRKAMLLTSPAEFESAFLHWPQQHRELLVQGYIDGPLEACDYVAQDGRVVGYFEAASVRTDMPDGTGFAVDFLSKPISPDVLAACREFCAATAYDGPGLLQFIRSKRDGRLYFVENNPRLSAGIAQPVLCGQDLPLLALRVAAARLSGESIPDFEERDPYRAGVRTHWLLRDLQGVVNHRAELTPTETLARLRDLVASCMQADNHMVWQWRDPWPSVLLYGRLLARLLRGTFRRET